MYTMPGAPSELDVAKTQMAAMSEKGPSGKYVWYTDPKKPIAKTEWPVVPFRADPHDDLWAIKTDAAKINDNIQVMFTDSDAEYQMRKRTDDEQARFDAWVSQTFDCTNPATNMMLQQIAPSLYKRREEVIDWLQNLNTRYAKIRMRGAKTEDDLRFQWLVDTGRLELPTGAVWDPEKWRMSVVEGMTGKPIESAAALAAAEIETMPKRYQAGYFSPLSWIQEKHGGSARNPANSYDIRGDGKHDYTPEYVRPSRNELHQFKYSNNSRYFPDFEPEVPKT